jgi:drug/metabolite transporter (DMT)-like permease
VKTIGTWKRFALVTAFIILGASNPVAVKAALLHGWGPLGLGVLRMGFIGLFFYGWSLLAGEHPLGPNGEARRYALAAAACKGLGVLGFYLALTLIPVNRAVIISTVSPVVNLALVHLLLEQERVRRHHVLGIAVTLAGILLLLALRHGGSSSIASLRAPTFVGDAAMITSVVFHQAMIVFEKKSLLSGVNPRQLIISTNLVSVSLFALLILFSRESLADIPTGRTAVALYLYLISFVGVILFYYRRWLVSVMEISYLNAFSHAGKALSILYAVLLLGERLPPQSLLAFGLILLGTTVAAAPRQRFAPSPDPG